MQTTILLQLLSIKQKNRTNFSLTIISIKCHVLKKYNNKDVKLKTYVHKQTITVS